MGRVRGTCVNMTATTQVCGRQETALVSLILDATNVPHFMDKEKVQAAIFSVPYLQHLCKQSVILILFPAGNLLVAAKREINRCAHHILKSYLFCSKKSIL